MKKSVHSYDRRNCITFYIREDNKELFNQFEWLINRDEKLKGFIASKKVGLRSIALTQLVMRYVEENQDKLKKMYKSDEYETEDNKINENIEIEVEE